ncbi:MAG: FAD:protein FMN transferase, partial [Muribaculaceae bacterium]|nr:FAD:protein FMN transferase [Muribaculaceae bacterium]
NYHEVKGKTVGHTISPVTGYPTDNGCLSATVIAPDCMMADALATSCMVMNPDSALTMIERLPDTEVLMVMAGTPYKTVTSKGFPNLHN